MKTKRLIALVLIFLLSLAGASAPAEQYITDIEPDVRALDIPTPSPVPTPPEATAQPTPEPTAEIPEGPVSYEIDVDLANQVVTVYRGKGRATSDIARQMICSSGTGNETPTGVFIMPGVQKQDEREEWYYIGQYRLHVQYASRIVNGILFHSLPSVRAGVSPTEDSVEALGQRASHGCIRLRPSDSRWIAENCLPGTEVHIFEGAKPDEALRQRLLESSFVAEEMTYDDFLAGEKVYSVSSESAEVQALQAKLAELGYILDESDGFFGAETHACVVEWQLENGHAGTGELNEEQLEALLTQEYDSEAAANRSRPARVRVKTALNLRSKPSAKSSRLATLHDGTMVRVLEDANGWYKVRVGTITGYVSRKYIEFVDLNAEVN